MKNILNTLLLVITLVLVSCSPKATTTKDLAPLIVFTHNIHGEFSPCGCRKKPLGGLVQVAGYFNSLKKKYPNRQVLYFDTGDTLYPAGNIPSLFHDSHNYSAKQVFKMLSALKITASLPGDQDFSQGVENYKNLVIENKMPILISNASEKFPIKSERFIKFEFGSIVYYFLSILDSTTLPYKNRDLVANSHQSIKETLELIKADYGKNHPAQQKMTFLLSHSGMSLDQKTAVKFPEINWIIGAHTQNFTQLPQLTEGSKTKIVQVLSRNHHIGLIDPISLDKSYVTTELNDQFTQFDGNKKWIKMYEEMNTKLEQIKKKELDAIGIE